MIEFEFWYWQRFEIKCHYHQCYFVKFCLIGWVLGKEVLVDRVLGKESLVGRVLGKKTLVGRAKPDTRQEWKS